MNELITNYGEAIDWLMSHGVAQTRILASPPDLCQVQVFQTVDLSNKALSHIPINFLTIEGDFNVSNNNLTALTSHPTQVDGDFYCINNNLINLAGVPSVKGKIYCSGNPAFLGIDEIDGGESSEIEKRFNIILEKKRLEQSLEVEKKLGLLNKV